MNPDMGMVLMGIVRKACAKDDHVAIGTSAANVLAFLKGYISAEQLQTKLSEIIDRSNNRVHLEFMDRE